jgi:glycosyltransferase involved in cell wall biosynthesis
MKIVILGGNCEKALNGTFVGGAEKQTALIAQLLAARGHDTTILESAVGNNPNSLIHGVKIVQSWRCDKGLPAIRSLTYRLPSLLKRIAEITPDIVYSRATSLYGALLACFAHRLGYKFVWGLAGDQDVNLRLSYLRTLNLGLYDRFNRGFIFNLAAKTLLKKADLIIAQTTEQYDYIAPRGCQTIVIPNIYKADPHLITTMQAEPFSTNNTCLWVGKFTGSKGEAELLEIARLLPSVQIRVVGHVETNFEQTALFLAIKKQENILLLGRLPYDKLYKEYIQADILIHTAPAEGFSNVFLEAWAAKLPVISLVVNPNSLLSASGLGFHANGDLRNMASKIDEFLRSPELRKIVGEKSRAYVASIHAAHIVSEQYESAFLKLINSGKTFHTQKE